MPWLLAGCAFALLCPGVSEPALAQGCTALAPDGSATCAPGTYTSNIDFNSNNSPLNVGLLSGVIVQSPGGDAVNLANASGPGPSGAPATLTANGAIVTNTSNAAGNNNTGLRIQSGGGTTITGSGKIDVLGTASDDAILAIALGTNTAAPATVRVTYGVPGPPGSLGLGGGLSSSGLESAGIQADNRGVGDAVIDASGNITGVLGAGQSGFYGLLAHSGDAEATGVNYPGSASVHYFGGTINISGNGPRGILVWVDGDGSAAATTDPGTTITVSGTDRGGPGVYVYSGSATAANSVTATVASRIMSFGPATTDLSNRPRGIVAFSGADAPILVTYTGPGITTQGGNGTGIQALSDSGSININSSGPITTNGSGAYGVFAQSGSTTSVVVGSGGPIDTFTGAVGPGGNILVTTSGPGAISTLGDGSAGIQATSTTGSVQVTALGAISTQGAESHGILGDSTTGSVNIDANSVITKGEFSTGVVAMGSGNVNVTIPQGGAVMGGWQPSVSGTGTVYGLPSAGVIFATAGIATLNNAGSIGALSDRAVAGDPQVTNNGTITGFVQFTGSNNSIINNGTFALRHFADTDGDGVRDTVRVAIADLGAGANNSFINNGTLALPQVTGATTLDSTGQYLPLGNANNAMALGGPLQGHLIGVATYTNSGVIDLHSNPVAGDVLVITNARQAGVAGSGTFVSNGGALNLDTVLNQGGATTISDTLVVDGTSVGAGGATKINIRNAGGEGALTPGDGILVVEVKDATRSATGAFALSNVVAAGPYEYLLVHGGLTAGTASNWYLRDEAGPITPEPPIPPDPPPGTTQPPTTPPGTTPPGTTPPTTTPPGTTPPTSPQPPPFYRMEAPLYSKISLLARQVGLLLLGTFHERQGDQFLLTNDEGGIWTRLIGVGLSQKFNGPLAPSFSGTVGGAQIGSDVYAWDNRSNRVGGFVSYANASGTVRGTILDDPNQLGGHLPEDVIAGGGYFTHIGDNGWYVDAVLMGSWYNAYPLSERQIGTHTTGSGITASLEGDYPWVLDEKWTLESMGQIIFTSLNFDSTSDIFSTLDFQPGDAWYGRLGARLEWNTTMDAKPAKPFFELNLWHGFGGTDTTVYDASIPIAIPFGNTDIEAAIGIVSQVSQSFSLNVRLGWLTSIEGNFQEAYKGQIGLRYAW
jgi:hypothetical protein